VRRIPVPTKHKAHYILDLQEFEIAASLVYVLFFLTCKVITVHGFEAYREVEVYFHSFLNLALDGGDWSPLYPSCFTPHGMILKYLLDKQLGGS